MAEQSNSSLESRLALLLRLIGAASLTALIFICVPYSWMDSIHAQLGMGTLPAEPVVGYMARSLSAMYAFFGGLFWVISFDLPRHRSVLLYIGGATAVLGVALGAIDWVEGMPLFWKSWEGPFVVALGLVIYYMSRKLERI